MTGWQIVYTRQAEKDFLLIGRSDLKPRLRSLIDLLQTDPFAFPPSYESLTGDLTGLYLGRINRQHRLVFEVLPELRTVKILRMWTHYE